MTNKTKMKLRASRRPLPQQNRASVSPCLRGDFFFNYNESIVSSFPDRNFRRSNPPPGTSRQAQVL